MNPLRCILFLQFATTMALGQDLHPSKPISEANAVVRSLYMQVINHQPIGIPDDADMKLIAPFLSTSLLHKMNLAMACEADFFRHNPEPNLNPTFEWLELGLFSGDEEEASPTAFHIQRTLQQTDGTIHVYLKLSYEQPPYKPLMWRVEAILVREGSQYLVDDVIYLKYKSPAPDYRLTEALSWGCDGPRWVTYPKRLTPSRQQK